MCESRTQCVLARSIIYPLLSERVMQCYSIPNNQCGCSVVPTMLAEALWGASRAVSQGLIVRSACPESKKDRSPEAFSSSITDANIEKYAGGSAFVLLIMSKLARLGCAGLQAL